jgi:soluble lytic murein transglycosylase-like protein
VKVPYSFHFAGVLAAMMSAASLSAHVIEVRNGTVVTRDGAGEVVWEDPHLAGILKAGEEAELAALELPAAAFTPSAATRAPEAFRDLLHTTAARHGVSPALLEALVWQESRWRQGAVSSKGAQGLAQLMPGTARELGVDPRDAAANLEGGARYLRRMLDMFDGDVERALAAYNAGPGRVQRARGIPAITETRTYVTRIMDRVSHDSSGAVK